MVEESTAEGREMTLPYTKRYVVGFGKGLSTEEYQDVQFSDGWITCYPKDTSKPTTIYPAHVVGSVKIYADSIEPSEVRRTWDDLAR